MMKRYNKIIFDLIIIALILFTLTSCSGVTPTVYDSVNEIDIYDTLDQPFPHQKQEKDIWCLHAAGSADLDYNGFDYSQEFLDTKIAGEEGYGFGTKLVDFVNNEVPGYKAKYVYIGLDKIKELINIYDLPIMVNQKANLSADPKKPGHFTVVIEYGIDYVTVSNPSDGKEHKLDKDDFLSLNVYWNNTDPNQNLSIVIYPTGLNLNLPPSAYKDIAKGDYNNKSSEPIVN